jgi:hypothetical protein
MKTRVVIPDLMGVWRTFGRPWRSALWMILGSQVISLLGGIIVTQVISTFENA